MKKCLHMLLVTILLAATSCQHKDLCIHHPHGVTIRVDFDWCNAPDANPQGMCVYFYPKDGGQPRRYDFRGMTGGEINITAGRYRILSYNNDNEGVRFGGVNSFDEHYGYTREGDLFEPIYGSGFSSKGAPRAKGSEDETVVICPDMIWGCTVLDVEIAESGLSYTCIPEKGKEEYVPVESKEQIITLYPCENVCRYSYEIRNVKNLSSTTQMCGSLSGMSGAMTIADGGLRMESVTIPFDAYADRTASKITGEFLTFGHHEDNEDPHNLMMYVWMADNSKYYYTFDVTDQIHTAPDPKRVHLVIDGLEFPKSFGDNNLDVGVDDWFEENIDIPM